MSSNPDYKQEEGEKFNYTLLIRDNKCSNSYLMFSYASK